MTTDPQPTELYIIDEDGEWAIANDVMAELARLRAVEAAARLAMYHPDDINRREELRAALRNTYRAALAPDLTDEPASEDSDG